MADFILVKLEADVISELIVTARSLRAAASSFQTTDFGRPIRVIGVIAPQGGEPRHSRPQFPRKFWLDEWCSRVIGKVPSYFCQDFANVSRSRSLTLSTHNAAYMRINTDLFGLRSNTDPKPKEIRARWNDALGLNQLLGKNFAPREKRAVSKINRPCPSPGKYPSLR